MLCCAETYTVVVILCTIFFTNSKRLFGSSIYRKAQPIRSYHEFCIVLYCIVLYSLPPPPLVGPSHPIPIYRHTLLFYFSWMSFHFMRSWHAAALLSLSLSFVSFIVDVDVRRHVLFLSCLCLFVSGVVRFILFIHSLSPLPLLFPSYLPIPFFFLSSSLFGDSFHAVVSTFPSSSFPHQQIIINHHQQQITTT